MHLEDGRFLVSPTRYDTLLTAHTPEDLATMRLVRVHERFRVIALGLPVPRYPGHPLDPPLRSRFQARVVRPDTFLAGALHGVPAADRIASHAGALGLMDGATLAAPVLSEDALRRVGAMLRAAPSMAPARALHAVCPAAFLPEPQQQVVAKSLARFQLGDGAAQPLSLVGVEHTAPGTAAVTVGNSAGVSHTFTVDAGSAQPYEPHHFVRIDTQQRALAEMLVAHAAGDVCLVGPRGCGKSALAEQFAALLRYETVPVLLHKDMSARDLLQQRVTDHEGNTAWRASALVKAAIDGR